MITDMIKSSLNEYHFRLNEKGIRAIEFQVELLYGKHPTEAQVNEIVNQNRINFIHEMRENEQNKHNNSKRRKI